MSSICVPRNEQKRGRESRKQAWGDPQARMQEGMEKEEGGDIIAKLLYHASDFPFLGILLDERSA